MSAMLLNVASGSEKLNLPKLPGVLTEAQHFASEACVQLKWSLEFHKNYLFGECIATALSKIMCTYISAS